MEKAIFQSRTIHLDSLPREQFQVIYEASKAGKVTCACCKEQVTLYLGIQQKPHFQHTSGGWKKECEEFAVKITSSSPTSTQQEDHYIERNGFKIPKSRSIQESTVVEQESWKALDFPKRIPPFEKKQALQSKSLPSGTSLDSAQWEAVSTIQGPLLILAGAGSGKTRVLTARTAYMIKEQGIDPKQIMLVTFTAKAAKEMKERLTENGWLTPNDLRSLVVGTFHSIFYKMVMHHEPARWNHGNLLKYDWQREQIIKEAGRELGIDEKEFAYDQALQQIGYWKNTLTPPNAVKPKDEWEERAHFMYMYYENKKLERGKFDFDDMLVGCYEMLKQNPSLLDKYQQRFHYFLIDEFQDINKVQYELMKMLSAHTNNLCVVGDDDQSIYAFRGSDPSFILGFPQEYPTCKVVSLEQNYRSTHSIVASANKVISRNKERHTKKMSAMYDNKLLPSFFYPYDEEEEATMIVNDMKERIAEGAKPSDFAILYRTNTSSRAVFERLSQSNLPFVIEQDSESFYQRRIVKTMLSFLRLSLNPNHTEAISDLLLALFLKQSALNDLKAMSILEDCSFVQALPKLTNIHPFQVKKLKKIVPLFATLKNVKPIVAIEMIERDMGFDDFIKKRGNEGNMIDKGSDDVRDLKVSAKRFQSTEDFLTHVDHMIAMNKEMKELSKKYHDAITLTTIHRAKGLEYKHVYVLSAVDGSIPHDYALEANRNGEIGPLEEERRLMYVAMTRAKESLFVSIPDMRRGKKANRSRFLTPLL
ncbi:ATP-dependent helicase [Bacillus timonensis]|nr:ATP-dependent helicase [Bacillus timonensis]